MENILFSNPVSPKFYAILFILQDLMFSFKKKQFGKQVAILTAWMQSVPYKCVADVAELHPVTHSFTLDLWNSIVFLFFLASPEENI